MAVDPDGPDLTLNLLTYNIQTAIAIRAYRDYITQSWRYLFPNDKSHHNLMGIGELIQDYDLVALQEVDVGSMRSGFVNQVQFLADQGDFIHWDQQLTRYFGNWVQQGNALLSRVRPPDHIEQHRLPGFIPGRGAIFYRWGDPQGLHLTLVIMHLALSPRARKQQLAYINEHVAGSPYAILMGDMNCALDQLLTHLPNLNFSCVELETYPSWNPTRSLDHILVSTGLHVESARALPYHFSDHLPVAVQISLPKNVAQKLALHPERQRGSHRIIR